ADTPTAPPDATLQDVSRAQLPPDLPDIDRLALVLEGGIASDDREVGEPRQLGCNILGHAIAEVVLLGVTVKIRERQHRDGGPIKRGRWRWRAGIGPGPRRLSRWQCRLRRRRAGREPQNPRREPVAAAGHGRDDGLLAVADGLTNLAHTLRQRFVGYHN